MRGNAELEAWGARVARAAPRPSSSARRTSARCSRRSSATSTASTRCRPASTSTSSCRRPRAEALAALLDGVPRRPAEPRQPPGAAARRGQRRAARRVPRRRRADRPLLRQAPLQQGRPRAPRGAARAGRARRSSSASATTGSELERIAPPRTLFTGPLEHRHLVPPDPARRRRRRARRSSPRRSGWSPPRRRPPAAPPLVARHSGPRGDRRAGSRRPTRPSCGTWRASRRATRSTSRDKLHDLLALPPERRRELGEAARRVAVEQLVVGGRRERLLEPFQPL